MKHFDRSFVGSRVVPSGVTSSIVFSVVLSRYYRSHLVQQQGMFAPFLFRHHTEVTFSARNQRKLTRSCPLPDTRRFREHAYEAG